MLHNSDLNIVLYRMLVIQLATENEHISHIVTFRVSFSCIFFAEVSAVFFCQYLGSCRRFGNARFMLLNMMHVYTKS